MPDRNPRTDAPVIAEGLFSFKIGGSERVGADMAMEFMARGYRVVCFAFYGNEGPIRAQLEAQGVTCIDLDYTSRPRLIRRATYQLEFYRFLKRFKVNALHVHHATALVLSGIPARLAGVKHLVMTEHALHQLQERPNYRKSATRYCGYASDITAVHAGIAEYFHREMFVPEERLHVIENGVRIGNRDSELRGRMRRDLGIAAEEFVYLFAGRLEAVKDVSTLLRSVAKSRANYPGRLRFIIAGDGSERERLEQLAGELALGRAVTFLGIRTDIPDLLQAADGFIMTSVTEGLPMALIEAMAAQVPCIATSVGGIPELFSGDAGLLVPPGQPEKIADAMQRLSDDSGLRGTIIENALAKVRERYDLDDAVTKYLALLGLPPHWSPG